MGFTDNVQILLACGTNTKELQMTFQTFDVSICNGNMKYPVGTSTFRTKFCVQALPCFYCFYEGGSKVLASICFLFTCVHLYKGGSVYIKYEPLSFMPCNMDSVARLLALRALA